MLTEKEIDSALNIQLTGVFSEQFTITENIRKQIIENFKKLGFVEEEKCL